MGNPQAWMPAFAGMTGRTRAQPGMWALYFGT